MNKTKNLKITYTGVACLNQFIVRWTLAYVTSLSINTCSVQTGMWIFTLIYISAIA